MKYRKITKRDLTGNYKFNGVDLRKLKGSKKIDVFDVIDKETLSDMFAEDIQ